MITTTNKKDEIVTSLFDYILDKEVFTELGEPLLYDDKILFFLKKEGVKTIGFAAIEQKDKTAILKYFYVTPSKRKTGVFSELYAALEKHCLESKAQVIKAVSTNMALEAYKSKGFVVTKSWINYHNIQKQL